VEILDLGGNSEENIPAPKRKKNRNLKLALGVGTLAVMVGLGSTLAANISLNSGGNVEFGQGVAQTISCQSIPEGYNFSSPSAAPSPSASSMDRSVTVTPISDFVNTGTGTFVLSSIQFSGLDIHQAGYTWYGDTGMLTSDQIAAHPGQYMDASGQYQNTCDGKWLIIKAYTDNNDVANASGLFNAGTSGSYYRTTDGTTASPLSLLYYSDSGNTNDITRTQADNYKCAVNSGIAVQLHYSGSFTVQTLDGHNCGHVTSQVAITSITQNTGNDGFTLSFRNPSGTEPHNFIEADASWIDKITVESADSAPSDSYTTDNYDF
jgi:hypothetical protein